MSKQSSPYILSSVDRALEVLIILGRNPRPMGVTELSKVLDVQKSTVHSLLQTLMNKGFVQQCDNSRYTLGVRLIQLGALCADRMDLRKIAYPIMIELAEETQEIALLAVLSGDELIIVEKVEPQRPFLIIPKFDFSIALHSTAVGKVLLAYAPDDVVKRVFARGLQRYTRYTVTDFEVLIEEFRKVRQQGYAIGCNETIEGVTCIAVPLYDVNGSVIASLSISSASSIVTENRYDTIVQILKQKAELISRRLGFHN